ncbi:MAG TPA: 50S ribosomal protein L11 methyltransferase [Puia sp.]|nr:50S ribosomal protein L11 methyltransferase [Puia sp.]
MNYIQITITMSDAFNREVLIALLSDLGYEGFEEDEYTLKAFIPEAQFVAGELHELLQGLPPGMQGEYTITLIPPKNWNEQWEKDFQPVVVEDFCAVRAAFHEPVTSVKYDLVITPKMSFGTGHHATTYMMMEAMQHLEFGGTSVLDFGTGTGVLAILAEKLGADKVLAIDYDPLSIENALENVAANGCSAITVEKMDKIPEGGRFGVILANINKNVLLQELGAIGQHLEPGGVILLSGLLQEDLAEMEKKAAQHKLSISLRMTKANWICLELGMKGNI